MALCARASRTQSHTNEEAQVEVNFQRKGEQWRNGNGQRFVMGHVFGQLQKLSPVAVSRGKQGLSNVWVMSRKLCRALGCSVYSAAVWKDGPASSCPVTMGCTAEPLQHCPPAQAGDVLCHWELSMPPRQRGLCCRSTCPAI